MTLAKITINSLYPLKVYTAVGAMIVYGGNTRLSNNLLQLLGIPKLLPITLSNG